MNKMEIEVIAFGIAKDIINGKSLKLELFPDSKVSDIKSELIKRFPEFQALASLKLAVNAEYVGDSHILKENDEVVLIPPVSGG